MIDWSELVDKYEKSARNIVLINIVIPILHSLTTLVIPTGQQFFFVILFFSVIQVLNVYQYRRNGIIYLYLFGLNFIGLVLAGEVSIFFALTSAYRIYYT